MGLVRRGCESCGCDKERAVKLKVVRTGWKGLIA